MCVFFFSATSYTQSNNAAFCYRFSVATTASAFDEVGSGQIGQLGGFWSLSPLIAQLRLQAARFYMKYGQGAVTFCCFCFRIFCVCRLKSWSVLRLQRRAAGPSSAAKCSSWSRWARWASPARASAGPALCWQLLAAPPQPTCHSTAAPKLTSRRGGELAGRAGRGDGRGRAGAAARRPSTARPLQRSKPRGAAGHTQGRPRSSKQHH